MTQDITNLNADGDTSPRLGFWLDSVWPFILVGALSLKIAKAIAGLVVR